VVVEAATLGHGPRDYSLFKHYPLNGTVALSTGEAPTPYHIYAGYGLFIGGVCEADAAHHLLQAEALRPLQTTEGKVVMGIWVCDFTDASLGPHHELQFSFFIPDRETTPLPAHPLNPLTLLLTCPDVQMLCYGLWNDTSHVVAYNREVLSLNARQTTSRIERTTRQIKFQFKDHATDQLILSGEFYSPQQPSLTAGWALMAQVGFRRGMALAQQPWIGIRILNPLGVGLQRHASAEAFTKNDVNVVRYFDLRRDQLEFGDTRFRALGFTPQCVQYMDGFKFVYLSPQ